ncbi:MAG: 50S ribosomal protein L25/general stress protein Ctc [Caulobacteraceae bacterium]|nr:50S ribosomal protein L25/general stress protein Ctc [Caulobacteraceae bacterium]
MAEIILNVEVRDRTGSGGSREARRAGKVPGVLYGGALGPVPVAVRSNEFRKALHSGKLLGHKVTLKHGDETQPVIAKDIQFHPVTDEPIHFDLYRVDAHQLIKISVPVHFFNHEASPGLKRGGALNVAVHEVELMVPADLIPEELTVDLTGLDVGAAIRAADLTLPKGAKLSHHDRDATVASIGASGAMESAAAEEA